MATIYSLFFGILFIAVCTPVGTGNGIIVSGRSQLSPPSTLMSPDRLLLQQEVASAGYLPIKVLSDTVLGTFAKTKAPRQSAIHILQIAAAEIGVREATGRNDGKRVEEYLRYTGLGKGYAWCAAFVSWCYGQAGLPEPRNPWSPALFPVIRTYCKGIPSGCPTTIQPADIFGIYGQQAKRINHVGLIKRLDGKYLVTIEGNSNNRVESKRRHLSTIYAISNWL